MINKTEFRIGNLVLFAPKGKETIEPRICPILELHEKICKILDLNFHMYLFYESSAIEPVKLTEDLLLRMGFEDKRKESWFTKDGVTLGYITTEEYFQTEIKNSGDNEWMLINLIYLHQLQNWWYANKGVELALTQSELIIK